MSALDHGSRFLVVRVLSAATQVVLPALCMLSAGGCMAPGARLSFPTAALKDSPTQRWYDVDRDGRADFGLLMGSDRRLRALAYDDDQDGTPDRLVVPDAKAAAMDGAGEEPGRPHLVLMLDSIPHHAACERSDRGEWPWFPAPVKVIPPFPTMSGLIFTDILHAPRLDGMINRHYQRDQGKTRNLIVARALGHDLPWRGRLHYRAKYWENGLSFLQPRQWFGAELARVKHAFDRSPRRVFVAYVASSAGMLSRFGKPGLDESLDGVTRLCLQLLYERRGRVDISILADHGHNLVPGKRIDLRPALREAGFTPSKSLRRPRDVVIENDGMVNYVGLHTHDPAGVAAALARLPQVQLVMRREGDRVAVSDAGGEMFIEHRDGRFRCLIGSNDALGYGLVLDRLRADGRLDSDGFADREAWFHATIDHRFPDAPPRLWRAFDGLAANTPDVMLTLRDGFCTGLGFLELFITMQSTHGGLDQTHSATFAASTTGRAAHPMRSDQVLERLEPGLIDQLAAETSPQDSSR